MAKFRKKPVVIEAVQLRWDTWSEMCDFVTRDGFNKGFKGLDPPKDKNDDQIRAIIPTLEGDMIAVENDWIIKGIKGEMYPIKDEIFRATYDPVEDSPRT